MKKLSTLCAILLITLSVMAQKGPVRRPDWTFEKPITNNVTFYYHVERATAQNEHEARNLALSQAFMQAAMRVGVAVDIEDINSAITQGTNLSVISERYEIPISIVCAYPEKREDGSVCYWILCQIAKRGGIIPSYEDFSDCYKFDKYHNIMATINGQQQEQIRKSNTRAIVASTFIPGMGQMFKKQGGAGSAFLISELILFGGGTACHFLGEEQAKIMKTTKDYSEYKNAKNMKNTMNIAMYTAFGVGAAVHIANMVHAWYVKDKNLSKDITFIPTIIPTNEYSTSSYAVGAGVQFKF